MLGDHLDMDHKVYQLDKNICRELTSIVSNVTANVPNKVSIVMGGSVVEGAAIARYLQPTKDGGTEPKNKEVEVDLNMVVAEIPASKKSLVYHIPGKPLNVRIASNKELHALLSEKYVPYFKPDTKEGPFVNSYTVKEAAARSIDFSLEEPWLKAIIALSKDKDTSDITFSDVYGEISKPTAASDYMVKIHDQDYVNISLDLSIMLKLEWMPEIGKKWVEREREWPPKEQIADLVDHSFLISKPSNEEKDNRNTTEFSISFHHLETRLANLRTEIQMIIYMKLKGIVYKYLKPIHVDIPSFNAKTVMLFATEKYPPDHQIWQNVVNALKYLVGQLLIAFEDEKLSYFFVPTINIMKPLEQNIKDKVCTRLGDIKDNIEKYINDLPLEKCYNFYDGILDDCISINKILELKTNEDFTQFPRILEDQFAPLKNKLEGNEEFIPAEANFGESTVSFVGRSRELKEIHDVITTNEKHGVVLHGMAGVGKSELARQYSTRYASKFSKIFLINGESKTTIIDKLKCIVACLLPQTDVAQLNKLDIKTIMEKVFTALAEGDSLLIFDNITNPTEFCSWLDVLRTVSGTRSKIIITAQKSDFDVSKLYLLQVLTLQKHDAVAFLETNLSESQFDEASADTTCDILGCHPLGIKLAIAFIQKKGIDLKEFNESIRTDQDLLLYTLFPPNYGKPLYSTLKISIRDVFESTDKVTIDILCLSAIMDTQEIEVKLLMEYTGDNSNIISSFINKIRRKKPHNITSSLQELSNRSLLRKKDSECYEMHSLIKKVVEIKIHNEKCKYVKTLLKMCSSYQKKHLNRTHTSFGDTWLHHALSLIDHHGNDVEIMILLEDVKLDIIDALTNKGDYNTLMTYLRLFLQSETTREESFYVIWKTSYEIGRCFYKSGDYRAGIDHLDELLVQCKEKYGEEHYNTLVTTNDLALCMKYSGDLSNARSLYQTVYDVRLRLHGDDHRSTLTSLNNLAACIWEQGDLEDARPLYEKVFDIRKRTLGVDHPQTLLSMNNLASCMRKQGELEAARSLYEQTYEIRQRLLGEHHPDTLFTMNNLALCMRSQGELEAARSLYEQTYEVRQRVLGEHHPYTLTTMYNLGCCMKEQGEVEGARQMLQKAYDSHKRILGNSHPETLKAKRHLDACTSS